MARRWLSFVLFLAVCLFSPQLRGAEGGKKSDPVAAPRVSPFELLKFVCEENDAWSMPELPLSESITVRRGKTIEGPSVSEAQQLHLAAIVRDEGEWPTKLLQMAAVTPLYVRIACKQKNHRPVAGVVEKFGDPERREPDAIIYKSGPTQEAGEWYCYGDVRLGVRKNGDILSAQVDSPQWRKLSAQVAAASTPAKRASKPAADAPVDPKKAEQIAANRLKLAKQMQANNPMKAREWLNDIVTRYPGTPSAAAAKELLEATDD